MIIYTIYYDIENNGNGVLGTYSTKEESIQVIMKKCFEESINMTKEEFKNNINQNNGYEWDEGYYQIESKEVSLELNIILYENFNNKVSHILGVTKNEECAITLIENDLKKNKGINDKNIHQYLRKNKEYSTSNMSYKILKNNINYEQEIYSCKDFYIIKNFEDNQLIAYKINGIFICASNLELNKFIKLIENILNKEYSII